MKNYKDNIYMNVDKLPFEVKESQRNQRFKDTINYPNIHIAPDFGLLNDPNGLAYFNNEYHIFHQACPNGTTHGMKSWYHITTKDFINYSRHGIKLKSENEFDNFGIFSGGALVTEDYLYLLYTGNNRDPYKDYKRTSYQCIARMNKEYEIEDYRVIINPDKNFHSEHFRDPVLAGKNKLLIGCQSLSKCGELAIASNWSKDGIRNNIELSYLSNRWNLHNAYMLECPNWFISDNKEVLIFSPQGMDETRGEYFNNIYNVVYSIGELGDIDRGSWSGKDLSPLDYGFDFYAPQTFTALGEILLIGWLGQAETVYPGDEFNGWSQMLTLVREVELKNGVLYQMPHRNYKKLRTKWKPLFSENKIISKTFELELSSSGDFELLLGNQGYFIKLSRVGDLVCLNREKMQHSVNEEYGTSRNIKIIEQPLELQIIVDMSCIEIYINKGKYVMSSRFFIDNIDYLTVNGFENKRINYLNGIKIQ